MSLSERIMAGKARLGVSADTAEDRSDGPYGTFMFFVFLTCVLIVAAMVCVLAVVVEWWMLAVVVALMLSLTAVVMAVLMGALRTTADSYPDLEDAKQAPSTGVVRPLRPVGVAAHRASTASHR